LLLGLKNDIKIAVARLKVFIDVPVYGKYACQNGEKLSYVFSLAISVEATGGQPTRKDQRGQKQSYEDPIYDLEAVLFLGHPTRK